MRWLGALRTELRRAIAWGMVVLAWGSMLAIAGCTKEPPPLATANVSKPSPGKVVGAIDEVAPPAIVQRLNRELDRYQPQVQIVAPRADETLNQTQVSVQLRVQDLPLFKDEALGAGPHLKLLLDDRPVAEIFDASEPIALKDLAPGSHTLRAFAERPWHESFKNDGAYAQVTFHVLTKTRDRAVDPSKPLLTYNQPIGAVGTEPVLLDFYLTNAPLHLLARERDDDEIPDWKIRVTVNGDSFVLDEWQSVYLKGFKRGQNWVKLELIDDRGEPLENTFNESVALVTFDPNQLGAIDQLLKGNLSYDEARALIDPNYVPPTPEPPVSPEATEIAPTQQPEPDATAAPGIESAPEPAPAPIAPEESPEPPDSDPIAAPADELEPASSLSIDVAQPAVAPDALPEVAEPAAPPEVAQPDVATEAPAAVTPAVSPEPVAPPEAVQPEAEPDVEPEMSDESAVEAIELLPEPSAASPTEATAEEPAIEPAPEPIEPAPVATPEPAAIEPALEPIAPAASSEPQLQPIAEPEPAAIEPAPEPIAPEPVPVVEPAIEPVPQVTPPAAPAKPEKPLSATRKQFLKWLKKAQQNLPDDLNLPFDIKQVPIPSGD